MIDLDNKKALLGLLYIYSDCNYRELTSLEACAYNSESVLII